MEPEREILPALGAFVVFRIDPIASLEPELIEDPETLAACQSLVNKEYVALAEVRNPLLQTTRPVQRVPARVCLQGEPKASPSRFMDASMSIPISPMTTETHPSGRIPLKPSTPLPWNDCYISCCYSTLIRSPTLFTTEPVNWILDDEESGRHLRFIFGDIRRSKALERKVVAENIVTATIPAPADGAAGKEPSGHSEVSSARTSISTKPHSISSNRSGADSTGLFVPHLVPFINSHLVRLRVGIICVLLGRRFYGQGQRGRVQRGIASRRGGEAYRGYTQQEETKRPAGNDYRQLQP
ncbi:hypothetical protein C8R46DRAFT_1008124 [Mycena filopes]|nr:hypothetical protein C8R46DRAFT_1008124 [Mycena filopes]